MKSLMLTFALFSSCVVDAVIIVVHPRTYQLIDWFYDEPVVPINSLTEGYIESANPSNGCQEMDVPIIPSGALSKIVLINDTGCSMMTKICNAKEAGYDAVVVFRTPDFSYNMIDQLLSNTKLKKKEYKECIWNITVTLISSEDANVIKDKYSYDPNSDENFIVRLMKDEYSLTVKLLLCFAVATFPFFVCSVLCAACRYARSWWEVRRAVNSIHKSLKKLFPIVKFSEGDPYESCAICWENFTIGENLRILKCLHAYHSKCIDAWLLKYQQICPMCKRIVALHDFNSNSTENTPLLAASTVPNYSPSTSPPNNVDFNNATIQNHVSERPISNEPQSVELSPPLSILNNGVLQNAGLEHGFSV